MIMSGRGFPSPSYTIARVLLSSGPHPSGRVGRMSAGSKTQANFGLAQDWSCLDIHRSRWGSAIDPIESCAGEVKEARQLFNVWFATLNTLGACSVGENIMSSLASIDEREVIMTKGKH